MSRFNILLGIILFVLSSIFAYWFVTHNTNLSKKHARLATNHGQLAQFGMGCFLSASQVFYDSNRKSLIPGILDVRTGYAGGTTQDPNENNIGDHVKVVQVTYNPALISYPQLLDLFWHNIDLFNDKGQFCDTGEAYKTAIFYEDESQKALAIQSKKRIEFSLSKKNPVLILPKRHFYEAAERYQNYCQKYPLLCRYQDFRCRKKDTLHRIWGDVACFHP